MSTDLEILFAAIRDRDIAKIESLLDADPSLMSERAACGPTAWDELMARATAMTVRRTGVRGRT